MKDLSNHSGRVSRKVSRLTYAPLYSMFGCMAGYATFIMCLPSDALITLVSFGSIIRPLLILSALHLAWGIISYYRVRKIAGKYSRPNLKIASVSTTSAFSVDQNGLLVTYKTGVKGNKNGLRSVSR